MNALVPQCLLTLPVHLLPLYVRHRKLNQRYSETIILPQWFDYIAKKTILTLKLVYLFFCVWRERDFYFTNQDDKNDRHNFLPLAR
jgi:hypothetical protein